MRKIHEVSKSIGVSKRTLQYYDEIGLLSPTEYTQSGYRLYDDMAVEKLWKILLLRELGYQLNDIKKIIDNPDFDLRVSIEKHIGTLTKKKERLEKLIGYASIIKFTGIIPLTFEEYGDITFEEFIENSKESWNMNMLSEKTEEISIPWLIDKYLKHQGNTWDEDEVHEIENIAEDLFSDIDFNKALELQARIDEFGNLIDKGEDSKEVQDHVSKLYEYISVFGSMSLNGFSMYGQMFALGGDLGIMHSKRLGERTTEFIAKAIQNYCAKLIAEESKER